MHMIASPTTIPDIYHTVERHVQATQIQTNDTPWDFNLVLFPTVAKGTAPSHHHQPPEFAALTLGIGQKHQVPGGRVNYSLHCTPFGAQRPP